MGRWGSGLTNFGLECSFFSPSTTAWELQAPSGIGIAGRRLSYLAVESEKQKPRIITPGVLAFTSGMDTACHPYRRPVRSEIASFPM